MGDIISIGKNDPTSAYLVKPDQEIKGAVIVIHEVWGLDEHIKNVADRFRNEGFIALAPDFFGGLGIDLPKLRSLKLDLFNPETRNEVQPVLRQMMTPIQDPEFGNTTLASLKECFDYLYDMAESKQHVSVMGFCFGGTYSYKLASTEPRLKAAIPFYGHAEQDVKELANIKCPVLAFYGANDERLIEGLDELKGKMSQAGVDFTAKVYPDCGHAFFNDTNQYAYNQAAAEDSWRLTLELLGR